MVKIITTLIEIMGMVLTKDKIKKYIQLPQQDQNE
jgi:hypothetical protein